MRTIEERVFRAYFRRFGKKASMPSQDVEYVEENGRTYVRLSNINGILAVYRIKDDNGLKFIKARHFYGD